MMIRTGSSLEGKSKNLQLQKVTRKGPGQWGGVLGRIAIQQDLVWAPCPHDMPLQYQLPSTWHI